MEEYGRESGGGKEVVQQMEEGGGGRGRSGGEETLWQTSDMFPQNIRLEFSVLAVDISTKKRKLP